MASGIRDKTALVTGGASGIGRATALAFAREGARVVVATARSLEAAEQTARQIQALEGRAISVRCDVTDEVQVEALVATTVETFGSLDFAFNNAGVGADGVTLPFFALTDLPLEHWVSVSDTNFKAIFLCLKHELRQMRKQCSGVIVNTASTAAFHLHPYFGAYAPSKAGAIALAKLAALENKGAGIRVNVVAPGPIRDTGMADRLLSCAQPGAPAGAAVGPGAATGAGRLGAAAPDSAAEAGAPTPQAPPVPPLEIMGVPDDVARVVIWLCSDEASFVNGNVVSVDGGLDIS